MEKRHCNFTICYCCHTLQFLLGSTPLTRIKNIQEHVYRYLNLYVDLRLVFPRYIGWQLPNISHLRLGFYTADIFAPEPTQQRDVLPVLKLLKNVQPDVASLQRESREDWLMPEPVRQWYAACGSLEEMRNFLG